MAKLQSQRYALGWYGARLWRFESAIVTVLAGINFGIRDNLLIRAVASKQPFVK